MKNFTRSFLAGLVTMLTLCAATAMGQSVLDPTDSVYTYNASKPPTQPAANTIGKWVRTVRLNWNTNQWKAYIYNGVPFRLLYPKSYDPAASDGKKYPMIVFYHGVGEGGPATDNEYSLANGGPAFTNAKTSGAFDGYILVFQSTGSWGPNHNIYTTAVINYMIANNKLDPFRVSVNGLSAGGYNSWNFLETYPQYTAAALPMSGIAIADEGYVNTFKFTPIWDFQGGLDGSPDPNTAAQVKAVIDAAGGNFKYSLYKDLGHGTWNRAWSEADFFPFATRAYASNPWTLFGRTQFCPGDAINLTVGVAPGYDVYQWRMNGNPLPNTTNSINVTQLGTYDCRVQRLGIWSDWSRTPVVIQTKQPTVTPPITVSGLMSKVIPAPDNNGVWLKVPAGYASYVWQNAAGGATLGTDSSIFVSTPGNYVAKVTEQYGCSSNFSAPFTVIPAGGPNKPDAASGLQVTTLSQTSLLLNWNQNPSPAYNETNFEIYQATQAGGPYKLVDITGADVSKDTIRGLNGGTNYYYIVRAVNNTAASAVSNEAMGTTIADKEPPTAPGNLTITGSTSTSVSLDWDASTDNVGVTGYYVYINGAKSYYVPAGTTQFTVNGLTRGTSYAFTVKATDLAGNFSPASNQVSGQALQGGLSWKYYKVAAGLSALPNYNSLTPAASGNTPNIVLSPITQTSNFGFLWQGYIIVPTPGTYQFRTNSDDGSKLYLGSLNGTTSPYSYSGTALVNNDGGHAPQDATSSAVTLQAGVYPIAIAYVQFTGGYSMTVSWKTPTSGGNFVTIPDGAFVSETPAVNGTAPDAPSNLVAKTLSYKSIQLNWKDNSTNETGFEIWRSSTSATSGYVTIGTANVAATSYIDSTVAPATRYYYQVRAINLYGQSLFTSNYTEAEWKFNNNYVDSTGNNQGLTAIGSPVFDAANKAEGTYSVKLNGTNQAITINNTGGFLQEAYTQRTIAFWMKATATSGTNKVIFDIGGADNGLALLLNSNNLIAAVASANTRANITAPFTSTGWNHIAVVYNGSSLLLYVNGTMVASKTNLTFQSLATTTNGARIGQTNGTNAYNTTGTYFGGWIDDFAVFNTALTGDVISSLVNFTYGQSNATSQALPAIPAAPSALTATAAGTSAINVKWTNNAVNAANVQLYRSASNNQNYTLLAVLPAGATTYQDAGLFSNATYYYKVNAINPGGASAYSNEQSATTGNVAPVIGQLTSQQVRYNTTTVLSLTASSVNGGVLTFTGLNLPAFATLTSTGNTTANLTLNPAQADSGSYPNLTVVVKDAFGGTDTTKFNLNVNNNYAPTINAIAPVTMNENDTLTIPLIAQNVNPADNITLSVSNLPKAFTLTPTGNGTANLFLHPNFAAAGTYTVTVTANDDNGLSATQQFTLKVIDKDPTVKTYVRFKANNSIGAPWNNVTGVSTSNLLDANNNNTGMGLSLPNWWWPATFTGGPTTGNNSGVYPDAVLQDYYFFAYFGGPDSVNAVITGMDPAKTYDLSFYAGSSWTGVNDNGRTKYRVGNQSATLYVQNNTKNTVSLTSLKPASDGTITFTMTRADAATAVGYINALVITQNYNDSTAPAAPANLQLQNVPGSGVQLNWTDPAYNESGYQVFRATNAAGPFTSLGMVPAKGVTFMDSTVNGGVKYYYQVQAYNQYGVSDLVGDSILTTNRIPKINPIADVTTSNGQVVTVPVTAVDDPTDHLTLTATGLPAFASFVDNGNGTGVVTIQPGPGTNGVYNGITVTATDRSDSSRSASFNIFVVEQNVSATYINFTDTVKAPRPWNTMSGIPFAGTVLKNIRDDSNVPTGVTVTIQDGFQGNLQVGMNPGNGTNLYPVSVMQSGFFTAATSSSRILISGLSPAKKYNFVLFNTYSAGFNCLTNFTLNGVTQSLDGSYNVNKAVQFNGFVPDASGNATINVAKASGADYAMISTLVIQAYDPAVVTLMAPADLRVINSNRTAITLQWQDRADNETGYEIWRAADGSGSYSLLTTVAANTTSYVDANLNPGTTFYYMVRAVQSGTPSGYSNAVQGYTYASQVYVAFNDGSLSPAIPAPWNVLKSVPQLNMVWNNFLNDQSVTTNMGLITTARWEGLYGGGVNTGNNSGIYPDNLMIQSYGMFAGENSNVMVTGLDLSKTYDFTFFASATGVFDATAYYTVNGSNPVYLNANLNKKGTITLYGVKPNADGTAFVTITAYRNAQFALIGGMIVKGYTASTNAAPQPPVQNSVRKAQTSSTGKGSAAQTNAVAGGTTVLKDLSAYPSPFADAFTLSVPAADNDQVLVVVRDLSGKQVYEQRFAGLYFGMNQLFIQPGTNLSTGTYFVTVIYVNQNKQTTIKVLKR